MKRYLFLVFTLFLLLTGVTTLWIAPYILYYLIVEYQFKTPFYAINKVVDVDEKTTILTKREMRINNKAIKDLSKNFPIQNWSIPLPLNNPLYTFAPIVLDEDKDFIPELGIEYFTQSLEVVLRLRLYKAKTFSFYLDEQPLFSVPWVKSVLFDRPNRDIWRDLFTKKIHNIPSLSLFETKFYNGEWIKELLYNLYIIHLRDRLLPPNASSINYYEDIKLGIIQLPSDEKSKDMTKEAMMVLEDNLVENFTLETLTGDDLAEDLRRFLLKNIEFSYGGKHLYFSLMKEFQKLSVEQQHEIEGFSYLFAAWTQNTSDRDFLKRIIVTLEKNPNNKLQINRLYEFAFSRFGEKFDSSHQRPNEGLSEQFLEKSIQEEEEESRKKFHQEEAKTIKTYEDENFDTDEERVQFYLKKAKEKGVDTQTDSINSD